MAYPLLVIKKDDIEDGVNNFITAVTAANKKKKKKVKVVKAVKKPAKKVKKAKKVKPVEPVRPSPFKVGDEVWVNRGNEYVKGKITKCIPPRKTYKQIHWRYSTTEKMTDEYDECQVFPVSIFGMIATDATKMKVSPIGDTLNKIFDADVVILAVYRQGQKRPWCYYVLPDNSTLFHVKKHKSNPYGYSSYIIDTETKIYKVPAEAVKVRLLPISSAPQEILTYLGVHIYSRKWIKHDTEL